MLNSGVGCPYSLTASCLPGTMIDDWQDACQPGSLADTINQTQDMLVEYRETAAKRG